MAKYVYIVIEGTYDVPFKVDEVFSSKSKAEKYVSQKFIHSRTPLFIVSKELDPYMHKYKSAYIVFLKDGQKQVLVDTCEFKSKTTIQSVDEGYGVNIPMGVNDTAQDAVKKAEKVLHYVLTHKSEFPLIQECCILETYMALDGYDENLNSRTRETQRKKCPVYDFDKKEILLDDNEEIVTKENDFITRRLQG